MKKSVKIEKKLTKKKWPVWVKILGVLSLVIIILLVVWLKITLPKYGSTVGGLLAFMVASWYFFAIVGMWVLGFLIRYLIKKKLCWIANTISFIGLTLFSVLFLVILIFSPTSIIFFGWLVPTIIYFIISLILINKAKKMEKTVLEKKSPTPFKRAIVWGVIGLIFGVLFYSSGLGKGIRIFNISFGFILSVLIFLVFAIIGFIIGKIKARKKTK